MSVHKIKNGNYQVRVRGSDGVPITKVFERKNDAEKYETFLKQRKQSGDVVTSVGNYTTLDEFFGRWFQTVKCQATPGWRKSQLGLYSRHVQPLLGSRKLQTISPSMISETIGDIAAKGLSEQTVLHVYNLLRKCFSDAVEVFQLLHKNPVHRAFRPKVPQKEAKFLQVDDVRKLMQYTEGKPYQLAICLGAGMGLRVGEIQALRWEDVDLENGILHVRRSYARLEGVFRDHPKGKRQHSHKLPAELVALLRKEKANSSSDLVAAPKGWAILDYSKYRKVLKQYCKEIGITSISTHGLRHSSSELWMDAGASRDDLRILFGHRDGRTTDRYVHDKGSRLEKAAKVIQLFPRCSKIVPNDSNERENKESEVKVND